MNNRNVARIFTLALALTMLLAFSLTAQAQSPNIGVFDMGRVMKESKAGKNAKSKLDSTYDNMQKTLTAKGKELEQMDKDLRKQAESNALSKEALAKKIETLQTKMRDYQDQMQKFNVEFAKTEAGIMDPLIKKAFDTAAKLGKQRGYILVLEASKAGAAYFESSMDLTNEIIKALN